MTQNKTMLVSFLQPAASRGKNPRPVVREGANAASMRLNSVREARQVVDFRWIFISSDAAHLLRCDPLLLRGQCLSATAVPGLLGQPALIDRYRCIVEDGLARSFEQLHLIEGRQDAVIHRAVREGDGVTVWLTNLSANRRAQAARLGIGSRRPA
jgi:hypothetical protein